MSNMERAWMSWPLTALSGRLGVRSTIARARAEIAPPVPGALTARAGAGVLWGAALLAAAALAAGAYLLLFGPGAPGVRRQAQSVLAMLDLRSPGARPKGELVSSKPAPPPRLPAVDGPATPRQRALGKIFGPEGDAPVGGEGAFTPPFQPDILADVAPQGAAVPEAPIGGGVGGGGLVGNGGGLGGGGGGSTGGGGAGRVGGGGGSGAGGGGAGGGGSDGGGGGGIPIDGGPTPVAPPVAAVPEPATWLMMIIAFGLCGSMIRRGRRRPANGLCVPAS